MKEFSSQDLQKKSSVVQEAALIAPIAITFRGRRRHVMMSSDEFERLTGAAEPRVYLLSEIPDDLLSSLADARMDSEHDYLNSEVASGAIATTNAE